MLVYRYLAQGHPAERLIETLGRTLLREVAEFHPYQMFEAGVQQYRELVRARQQDASYVLVGVARCLAARGLTVRSKLQTAHIDVRLQHGEATPSRRTRRGDRLISGSLRPFVPATLRPSRQWLIVWLIVASGL